MTWWQIALVVWALVALVVLALAWWPRWPRNWANRCADLVVALCWPALLALVVYIIVTEPRALLQNAKIMWGPQIMIGEIENAILARLQAASDAGVLGYEWATLETYPEDWSEYLGEAAGTVRAPAAWVVFAGWRPDPNKNGTPETVELTFGLVFMAENFRNEQATRHGDGTVPGSYQLAVDGAALLDGNDLGLAIEGLRIGALRLVRNPLAQAKRKLSMLALELRTSARLPQAPDLSGQLDDFTDWHANWDLPPFTLAPPLPVDATADATDHVQLETE